jgi:CHAD domain-containing protein
MKIPAGCAAGAEWVSRRLDEQRATLRRDAARKLTPRKALARLGAWEDLEREVHEAQPGAGPLLARVAPEQVRAFAARADRLASAPAAAPTDAAPDDVHELRVAGKLLRYTLELAEPLGHAVPNSVAKEFKALQEALGLWHDYVVLAEQMLAQALEAGLASHHPELFGQVMELARACWRRSEKHLDQFKALWAQRGAALADRAAGTFATPAADAPPEPHGDATEVTRPQPAQDSRD